MFPLEILKISLPFETKSELKLVQSFPFFFQTFYEAVIATKVGVKPWGRGHGPPVPFLSMYSPILTLRMAMIIKYCI